MFQNTLYSIEIISEGISFIMTMTRIHVSNVAYRPSGFIIFFRLRKEEAEIAKEKQKMRKLMDRSGFFQCCFRNRKTIDTSQF